MKPEIVLIHGLWMTPRSWEHWVPYLEGKGFTVHTPTYPGFEVEVEELRADPSPIAAASVLSVTDHLAAFIGALENAPILIGHSFGGTLTQLLMARGLGAVWRCDQLGSDRGCADDPVVADSIDVPHSQGPGQSTPGGRVHPGAVPLCVYEHDE